MITLTSDIGLQDYLVGAIKGVLSQTVPEQRVIDISHNIVPFNFPQATYICKSAFPWFPQNSYHFVLINLLVNHKEPLLFCKHQDHYYFCANNGLISMILDGSPEEVYRIPTTRNLNTLEIVQLFADCVKSIEEKIPLDEIGVKLEDMVLHNPLIPLIQEDYIEGQIVYIDHFENVIVNITKPLFEKARRGRSFKIYVMRDDYITKINRSYTDVPEGGKVAFFNTAGYLEIAMNKGNAAGLLGLKSYSQISQGKDSTLSNRMFYQTIRIYFE